MLTEIIHVRVTAETREWLRENFPAQGDVSWVLRELIETFRTQWERGDGPVAEVIADAIERSF